MRKLVLGTAVACLSALPTTTYADDDRCEEGDCCVGIIAVCDNEFPLVPGTGGGEEGDEDA